MEYYAGLDVSLEATSVCVVNESGVIVCERKVVSDPDTIDQALRESGGSFKRIGLEAGPPVAMALRRASNARLAGALR